MGKRFFSPQILIAGLSGKCNTCGLPWAVQHVFQSSVCEVGAGRRQNGERCVSLGAGTVVPAVPCLFFGDQSVQWIRVAVTFLREMKTWLSCGRVMQIGKAD